MNDLPTSIQKKLAIKHDIFISIELKVYNYFLFQYMEIAKKRNTTLC
jgi:hypothetical protein